jgi:hypothetical protein
MIRILAASLAAAAVLAASLPVAAQQRHQGPGFRGPSQPSITGQRFSGRKQLVGRRKSRSFNPPAPQISSGKRFHRSFNPPAPFGKASSPPRAFSRGLTPPGPNVGTSQRSFGPQAPSGGQNFVGGPGSVPASLPAPPLGQSSPTDAPQQSTEAAPQGELQPPIPETVAVQAEPATTAEKVDEVMPDQVVRQVVHVPVPKPVVRHVYEVRVVYVPVYRTRRIYRRHHVYAPRHVFRGHRAHYGPRFRRGFRRW